MTKLIVTLATVFIVLIQVHAAESQSVQSGDFSSITRKELEVLFADIAVKNPVALKRLLDDPESKGKQLDNLRQLLAFASQAQKDGLADEPTNRQELINIRAETIAVNYDNELNKNKAPKPQLGYITDRQVREYWGDASKKEARDAAFKRFIDSKLGLLKKENPAFSDAISPEETQQARDFFAKNQIDGDEYAAKAKAGTLSPEFIQKTNLQVKLQQAQFLARVYSDSSADKTKVTDDETSKYIADHAELNPDAKKAKALDILKRAKEGEDFASLANQFTEDPGNKGENGKLNGGLYADVKKGIMVAPFEKAALALQPGQVSPELVESDFGYHIIKLEKKSDIKNADGTPNQIYDVRHILIETMVTDPADPSARPQPVREYVRQKLSKAKQRKLIDDIVAANHISVPADFTIPIIPGTAPVKKAPAAAKKTTMSRRKTAVSRKHRPLRKRTSK